MPGLDTTGQLGALRAAPEVTVPAPSDPVATWARDGQLVSPSYTPHLEAVRRARTFVTDHLRAIGLPDCSDDAGLMVSELAANAVLHARSTFRVFLRPTLEAGVRVEVHDLSPLPPVFTIPSATAMSGRGLNLVQTMAVRWGSHPLASPIDPASHDPAVQRPLGKIVWFELEASGAHVEPDNDIDELIALWSDDEEAQPGPTSCAARSGGAAAVGTTTAENQRARKAGIITSSMPALNAPRSVVVRDLPVRELLAAKEAVDDLLREVQLLLLATPPSGTTSTANGSARATAALDERHRREHELARRLDATARDFEHGRRQVREQVSMAAARGEHYVTLSLRLPASAARQALRYRDAVEEASQLGAAGQLLAVNELDRHTAIRRRYLDAIVAQLSD